MDMKRFFLYAISIAALALAGCGGGNGGLWDTYLMNGNGDGNAVPARMPPPVALATCDDGCRLMPPPGCYPMDPLHMQPIWLWQCS